jgi:phospholipid/cholesterol/gamma-HCH transport system substrate-binding protein
MVSRSHALLAGIFVASLAALVVLLIVWLTGERVQGRPYVVVARTDVTGLLPSSRVLYRGLKAGKVEKISVDPTNWRRILVRVSLRPEVPVTRGTFARLHIEGISGVKQVVIDDTFADPRRVSTSDRSPARIPLKPGLLDRLAEDGSEAVAHLSQITKQLSRLFDDETRERLRRTIANLEALSASLAGTGQVGGEMGQVARAGRSLLDDVRRLSVGLDALVRDLRRTASRLGRASQDASEQLTERTLPRATEALERLSEAAREVERLSRSLRQNPQQILRGGARPPPGPGEAGDR